MKKIILLFLAVCLSIGSFVGCDEKTATPTNISATGETTDSSILVNSSENQNESEVLIPKNSSVSSQVAVSSQSNIASSKDTVSTVVSSSKKTVKFIQKECVRIGVDDQKDHIANGCLVKTYDEFINYKNQYIQNNDFTPYDQAYFNKGALLLFAGKPKIGFIPENKVEDIKVYDDNMEISVLITCPVKKEGYEYQTNIFGQVVVVELNKEDISDVEVLNFQVKYQETHVHEDGTAEVLSTEQEKYTF